MSTTTEHGSAEHRLRAILAEQVGIALGEITADKTFAALSMDSLDIVEVAMAVEDTFSIEIPDEDVALWTSLSSIVVYLASRGVQ